MGAASSWSQQPPPPSSHLVPALLRTAEGGNSYIMNFCTSSHFLRSPSSCFFDTVFSLLTPRENAHFWHVLPLTTGTEGDAKHGRTSKQ